MGNFVLIVSVDIVILGGMVIFYNDYYGFNEIFEFLKGENVL